MVNLAEVTFDYIDEYHKFQNDFKLAQVSAEEVGFLITRMCGYFIAYNLRYAEALREYSKVKANFQNQIELTGKTISSSKAESLADSTVEAERYELARVHIQNLEQIINGLKALQRSLLKEYGHTG